MGVARPDRTGFVRRRRGDGGPEDSLEPGRLWWSMRKYSGLAKLAAALGLEPWFVSPPSRDSFRIGRWQYGHSTRSNPFSTGVLRTTSCREAGS